MSTSPRSADVQILLDVQAIYEVLVRYCRGVDRADEALVRSTYHDDSSDDRGWWRGTGADFAAFIARDMSRSGRHSTHVLTNVTAEVEGDAAAVESYITVCLHEPREGSDVFHSMGGRYLDRFARRDGRWAITRRQVVRDWKRVDELHSQPAFVRPAQEQLVGVVGPDDPSYELFSSPTIPRSRAGGGT